MRLLRRVILQIGLILGIVALIFMVRTRYYEAPPKPTTAEVVAAILARPPLPDLPDPAQYIDKRLNYGNDQWDLYVFDTYAGTETRLTATVQRENEPQFSPDGQTIAFYANRPGVHRSYDIFSIGADGSEFRNLTDTRDVSEGSPAWSPDGARIAYGATHGGAEGWQVYIMHLATGETTQITNSAGGTYGRPEWSPDGSTLAMANRRDGASEIVLHDLQTGKERALTHHAPEGRFPGDPAWSPDGKRIVYTLSKDPSTQLYVLDVDGGKPVHIETGIRLSRRPVWVPEGKTVTFAAISSEGKLLMSVGIDGSDLLPISALPDTIARSGHVANTFDRSPDGRRFAYVDARYDPTARASSNAVIYDDGTKIDFESIVELTDLPASAYAAKGEDGRWVFREISSTELSVLLEAVREGVNPFNEEQR